MRINGDFEEQVTREFNARRGSMDADLARLGPRPSQSHRAVTPAVALGADAVQISPEARAAVSREVPGPLLLRPFPSPAELVAAVREILAPAGSANAHHLVPELAVLLGNLAEGLPGSAPPVSPQQPSAAIAARIVNLLLGEQPGTAPRTLTVEQREQVVSLLRDLFTLSPGQAPNAGGQPTAFERAAAAILLAVIRWRALPPEASPGLPGSSLPAALYSLAGGLPAPRLRKRRERSRDERELPLLDDDDDEPAPDPTGPARAARTSPGTREAR